MEMMSSEFGKSLDASIIEMMEFAGIEEMEKTLEGLTPEERRELKELSAEHILSDQFTCQNTYGILYWDPRKLVSDRIIHIRYKLNPENMDPKKPYGYIVADYASYPRKRILAGERKEAVHQ